MGKLTNLIVLPCMLSHVQLFATPRATVQPPRLSVQGIFQAGVLEWVAISFSLESSRPRDQTCISCISCIGRQGLNYCAMWEALSSHTQSLITVRNRTSCPKGKPTTDNKEKSVIQYSDEIVIGLLIHLLIGSEFLLTFTAHFTQVPLAGSLATLSNHPQEANLNGYSIGD